MKIICFLLIFLNSFNLFSQNYVNYAPLMTSYIIKSNILAENDFTILDIGASGGFSRYWKSLEPYVRGFCFDPLVNEIERLKRINSNPSIHYYSYYVVSENEEIDSYKEVDKTNVFERSSAVLYAKIFDLNYQQEVFNSGQEMLYADQTISLDRFCFENNIKTVDFIKTDTDGSDFKVLCGAKHLLEDDSTLGLLVECMYVANFHPFSNVFRNIDYLLVGSEFTLFDLSTYSYTRGQLPGKFLYSIPAQTTRGQVCWGDVLYLKDFVRMKQEGKQIPTDKLIKMACIQEIFGLPDCAAELIMTFRDQLAPVINVDDCLDFLARDMKLYPTYQQHIKQFENPRAFFP